jgi:hypothetical protein
MRATGATTATTSKSASLKSFRTTCTLSKHSSLWIGGLVKHGIVDFFGLADSAKREKGFALHNHAADVRVARMSLEVSGVRFDSFVVVPAAVQSGWGAVCRFSVAQRRVR